MLKFLFAAALCLTQACAHYHYEHRAADGSVVVLNIVSMREVAMGDITLDENGALTGSADKLGPNEKLIEATGALIRRIPVPLP